MQPTLLETCIGATSLILSNVHTPRSAFSACRSQNVTELLINLRLSGLGPGLPYIAIGISSAALRHIVTVNKLMCFVNHGYWSETSQNYYFSALADKFSAARYYRHRAGAHLFEMTLIQQHRTRRASPKRDEAALNACRRKNSK